MCGWTKMIVSEHGAHRAIDTGVVNQRIEIPTLNGCLRSQPALANGSEGWRPVVHASLATRIARICSAIQNLRRRLLGFQRFVWIIHKAVAGTVVDGFDRVLNFLRAKCSVLIVETITRSVRRSDVKLHEVDVLTENVSSFAHLEIINHVIVGHQIRVPVFDDVSRVTAEEEWFGLVRAGKRRVGILPQRQQALLRVMPSEDRLIERHIHLNGRCFVNAFRLNLGYRIEIDWIAVIVDCWIGKRRTRLRPQGQTVKHKTGWWIVERALRRRAVGPRTTAGTAVPEENRLTPAAENLHRPLLHTSAVFRQRKRVDFVEVLTPIKLRVALR